MTKMEMAMLGTEFHANYYNKYHEKVTETYKYCGEIRTRETIRMTAEGENMMRTLTAPMFTCPTCGRVVSFLDLEVWDDTAEAVAADRVECSLCYEEYMGEDL